MYFSKHNTQQHKKINTYAGKRTENVVTGTPDACKIHRNNTKKSKNTINYSSFYM